MRRKSFAIATMNPITDLRDRLLRGATCVRERHVALHERREQHRVDPHVHGLDPTEVPREGPRRLEVRGLAPPRVDDLRIPDLRFERRAVGCVPQVHQIGDRFDTGRRLVRASSPSPRTTRPPLAHRGFRAEYPDWVSWYQRTSSSPRRQHRKTGRPSTSPGKSTRPVSGSRSRMPRLARWMISAFSDPCAWNQSLPATPPPSAATASVIARSCR